jgi:pectinesterase
MKNKIFILSAFIFCSLIHLYAQQVTAVWSLTNPSLGGTGYSVITSGPIVGFNEFFMNTEVNQYTGPNSSQRIRMAGTNNTWPPNLTNQIDTVWVQFAVTPQTSYKLLVDSVSLGIAAASSSSFKANIYYSKDSSFTTSTQVIYSTGNPNNYLPTGSLLQVRSSAELDVDAGEKFYLRIYPWNESSVITSGKYLCLQDITVYATAEAIPNLAYVNWPLETDESPVISGLLAASDESFSDSLYLYGFTTVGNIPCAWMTTVNHYWPANSGPDFDRWVQYKVLPQIGGTFYIDSVSFSLGAAYTNNLKAAVYYSHDSTFATKTLLLSDTSLIVDSLVFHSFNIKDTVETGETFYLRIFPYNKQNEGWAKLMYVSNVGISGYTTGLAIMLPTITTAGVTYISTTFATSGGNISSDGGGTVYERGVCWNLTGDPTITDNHTSDGTGTGMFESSITGLTPGTNYYLRSYATNITGSAYGNQKTFSTLTELVAPTVTTSQVTNIQVTTAICGGNVTQWGGDPVTTRGVCWDTIPTPTLDDNFTIDGSDIGTFSSGLTGLSEGTNYYIRAYATNSVGTGYGNERTFTTQIAQPDIYKTVALDGSGDYTTVQAAFNDVPMNYTGQWTIFVKKGVYYEKDTLVTGKINVLLIGEDRDSTIITYDDYADRYGNGNPGTSGSFSVAIDANDFIAQNITFQNTYSPQPGVSGTQAVAIRTNGDRQEYINCNILGFQDTYYTWGGSGTGRLYHKKCHIEGIVDFIFGRDIAVFDSCTIRIKRNSGTLTAASTEPTSHYGYVFRNCIIVADSIGYNGDPIISFYLGRPWQASPRTVYLHCYEPWNLNPAGWLAWNVTPALYAEYNSFGPGSSINQRVPWSTQLSDSMANTYSLSNIFSKDAAVSNHIVYDWMPTNATPDDNLPPLPVIEVKTNIPEEFKLDQNYPNPFNPSTKISFSVPVTSKVTLRLYDVLGNEIETLVDDEKAPGNYIVDFNANRLATGVYFYRLISRSFNQTKKMLLLK